MNDHVQRNLSLLLGDPKKAIIKLSIPIMIGSMVQTLYNFVDGIWVSGVGADSLAAVGLFMPFMLILSALGMGIGVGGSSAISRAIGSKDRARAGNVAEHTLIMGTIIGTAVGLLMLPFLNGIFLKMGASAHIAELATAYGTVIILGTPLMFLSSLGNAILRGEGDTKRAMYVMLISSILNMILDPIFIFTFNMGVVGAAVATVISIAVSATIIMFWLLVKKDTYVQLRLRYFHRNWSIIKEIFAVGLPSSFAQISMSLTMIILNTIVISAGGDYGMSVFAGGWRVVMLAIVPLTGIAAAVTSVTGAAYGAKNMKNLKIAYLYGVKIGTVLGAITGALIWIFAPQLTYLFTYSESSASLAPGIIEFLRYIVFYFPAVAAGMLTSSMFRGIKKGTYSFIQTILRGLVMQVIFTYLLGIVLGYGLAGIWIGIVIANIAASAIALPWGLATLKKVEREWHSSG
ncbi:MAG: MATE family efflux transporter [Euryarchaeota archaeon]|nr:MATE family efflux transporter [Euryarchaeota archaeon]